MRTIRFVNPRDKLLHIETPLGIVNIRVGLRDSDGRAVDSIEIIPNAYDPQTGGERPVSLDGWRNNRLAGDLK